MLIDRVVLASMVLYCGLFLVPRFIQPLISSDDLHVTRIMKQYQLNANIAQKREQIAQRVVSWIDNSTDPCHDFYQFACGGALRNPPNYVIPDNMKDDKDIIPFSFLERGEQLTKDLNDFFNSPSSPFYKVHQCCLTTSQHLEIDDYYRALLKLNSEIIQNATSELLLDSQEVSFWKINFLLQSGIVSREILVDISQGDVALFFGSSFLSLLMNRTKSLEIYKKYSSQVLGDEKIANASKLFDQIAAIECPFDVSQTIMSVANLTITYKDIPFEALLGPYNIPDAQVLLYTSSLDCISKVTEIAKNYDFDEVSLFFSFITIGMSEPYDFLDPSLCDATEIFPRDLRDFLFNEDADITARKMYHYIKSALLDSIEASTWMDEPTQLAAKKKALRLAELVQIPDVQLPKFEIEQCSPYNFYFEFLKQLYIKNNMAIPLPRFNRIQWPIASREYSNDDDSGYSMINAFYIPDSNIFVLPYGILGSPFFETSRPTAMNFGSIGSISAHETSHGYDPQGRMYDELGTIKNWWTNVSSSNYMVKSQCFVDEYSKIPINGSYFSGSSTLNENIADNAGLFLSWNAFKKYEAKYGKEESLISEYSVDQLFFISFAQTNCVLRDFHSPDDPHSPPKARVLGSLRNSQSFADTFKCAVGSNMNPVSKCAIWESSQIENQITMNSFDDSIVKSQKIFVQGITLILSFFIFLLKI